MNLNDLKLKGDNGMLYNIFIAIKNAKLKTKLLVFYIAILAASLIFLSLRYYYISEEVINDLAGKNVYEILRKSNQIVDAKLAKIDESSLSILNDVALFNTFKNTDKMNILEMDRTITSVLSKYFSQYPEIYSVQIITSYFIFGSNTYSITSLNGIQSDLYQIAVEGKGKLRWIPPYDYIEMFNLNELKNANIANRYFISATRLINSFYLDNGVMEVLDSDVERPVLVINIKDDFLRHEFNSLMSLEGSNFFITYSDKNAVFNIDSNEISKFLGEPWFDTVTANGSGSLFSEVNGIKSVICYDSSDETGWISVAIIPINQLMGDIIPAIKSSMLIIAGLTLIVLFFLACLITNMITKPIDKVVSAIKEMEKGNFDTRISVKNSGELSFLIQRFNELNERIKTLIKENYETAIREKETEIMALNLQLNPHFLYNTLNIINWMAIESKNKNISDMIMKLCEMLLYTVRDKNDLVPFSDDLKWLRYYLDIMAVRFENKFSVIFDIKPEIYESEVPKLFLQPFIENAIIHGFEEMDKGGVITVRGNIENNTRCFYISDNGKGMLQENIKAVLNSESSSIGVSNINKRIKLLYGVDYGVSIKSVLGSGTTVKVTLPWICSQQSKNSPPL